MTRPSVTSLILAAGHGSRFGPADKLSANLAGRAVVAHVVERALDAGVDRVCVLWRAGLAVPDMDVRARICTIDSSALGRTIAHGVEATPDSDAWLIWPGDMPLVMPETVRRVVAASEEGSPTVPVTRGRRGHPVLFPAAFGPALRSLVEDRGARSVLAGARRLVEVKVDDPGILLDIDTPGDLTRAERLLGQRPAGER